MNNLLLIFKLKVMATHMVAEAVIVRAKVLNNDVNRV
jgi:hypothetical protein